MKRNPTGVLVIFLLAVWAMFLPRLFWPNAALYVLPLSRGVDAFGSAAQFAPLAAGSFFALRAATRLERGNRAKVGWWLLGGWLCNYALGEAILSAYRLRGLTPPVPCLGDAFFILGYALLILGAVWFVAVYAGSGLPLGSLRERVILAAVAAVLLGAIGWVVLSPVARAPRPLVEVLVSAGYPVLDFVVMVPVVLLVRMTSRFHGGSVWTVWGAILLGFIVLAVADTAFAYADLEGSEWANALTVPVFASGYAITAYGAAVQSALLRRPH